MTNGKAGSILAKALSWLDQFRSRRERKFYVNQIHTKHQTFSGTLFHLIHNTVDMTTEGDVKEAAYKKGATRKQDRVAGN